MARRRLGRGELPSNHKTVPNRREIEPVVRGKKRSRGSGLAVEVQSISNSLFAEIVLPAIKNAIVDFFSNGVAMMMFGQSNSGYGGREPRHRSYDRPYRQRSPKRHRREPRYAEPEEVFEDIFYRSRSDAELVLGKMMSLTADYGVATMGDLYNLAGLSSNRTHERYGWTDLGGTRVQYTPNDGYVIDFPEPEAL